MYVCLNTRSVLDVLIINYLLSANTVLPEIVAVILRCKDIGRKCVDI